MTTKTDALANIRKASERFLAEGATASAKQWTFRPMPGQWSMAEVTEHVAIANQGILRVLSQHLQGSGLGAAKPDVIDDEIPYLFYRGEEPPNVGTPTGTWTALPEAAKAFGASVQPLLDWVAAADFDLRQCGVPHPVFGLMDGVQWLLFAVAHTERHRAQLVGLRRHKDFPS
jgi:uncharacterized damage-inducible protein DinB